MRVLHLSTHLNSGGITSYLLGLIPEQNALGNDVFVWGANGSCREAFEEICVKVQSDAPRTKSELSPRLWSSLPKLISFLKENSIDVMHAHTRVTQVLASAASTLTGIPFVSTAHGFYKTKLGRKIWPCWGKEICAISEAVRDGLKVEFGEKNLPIIRVVHNGVDVEGLRKQMEIENRESVRQSMGYSNNEKVILSVSRLRPSKGIHHLVSGFANASRRAPELRLLIVGGGDDVYRNKLEAQVENEQIGEQVMFAGNQESLVKFFVVADIFVAPNLPPEGFGLSILEAMNAKLPIAASNTGGISELLERGRLGVLFEPGSDDAIGDAIFTLVSDEDHAKELAKAAGEAALHYSTKVQAEKIQECYGGVLNV
jgi:glycosyltransferase involved in cell wall biosynthesis